MTTQRPRGARFLDQPIDAQARLMVLVATVLLAVTYVLPLWNLTMFAPQYPDGLRLDIYSYTLVGGNDGQDIKEINVLNHYIGMRDLVNAEFTEFQWMPFVIGALGLLLLRTVVHATVASLVDVTMLFVYFGAFSLWSFGYKLYRYGHELVAHCGDAGAALHAADVRLPADRQLRGVFLPASRRRSRWPVPSGCCSSRSAWTWWRLRRFAPPDEAAGQVAR